MKIPGAKSEFHQDPYTNPPVKFESNTTIIKTSSD